MMYIRWAVLAVLSILIVPVAWILAPVLPVFASRDGWLPAWLIWFQTPDNALDGDEQYRTMHAPFIGAESGWERYSNRVFWLWRNPAYGFDFIVLGCHLPAGCTVRWRGDPAVRNRPNGKAGYCYTVVSAPDGRAWWHLRVVFLLWPGECLDINLGWRLQTFAEDPGRLRAGVDTQYVFSLRPTPFAS